MNLYFFTDSGLCARKTTLQPTDDALQVAAMHLQHLPASMRVVPHPHDLRVRDIYFDGQQVRMKTPCAAKYDAASQTLYDLPLPCTVMVDGVAYPCNESTAELDLPPGHYRIAVRAVPHSDYQVEIDV